MVEILVRGGCDRGGRLTLNILLSFAQFEREIISERTRDKIAAARRKGKWAGGRCVLGYDVDPGTKKLVVNLAEAEVVRDIFNLYLAGGSLLDVAKELNGRGLKTKLAKTRAGVPYGGKAWDKSMVRKTLCNPLYSGRVRHKDQLHPGEHQGLVGEVAWASVQARLKQNGRAGGPNGGHSHSALLRGLLYCGPCGVRMGHTCSIKNENRVYKYYTCYVAQKQGWEACPCKSLPAHQIESFVVDQIAKVVNDPAMRSLALSKGRRRAETERDAAQSELEIVERDLVRLHADLRDASEVAATDRHAGQRLADLHDRIEAGTRRAHQLRETIERASATMLSKEQVDAALGDFQGLWSKLSPKEQHELVRLLVQRVDYDAAKRSVSITFHQTGLRTISQSTKERAA